MRMSFEKVEKREFGGRCMIARLGGVAVSDLSRVFGKPLADAYWDDEKGYDGIEYAFEASDGRVVTIYTRWGCSRIGGRCDEDAVLLVAWLHEHDCPKAEAVFTEAATEAAVMAAHAAVGSL